MKKSESRYFRQSLFFSNFAREKETSRRATSRRATSRRATSRQATSRQATSRRATSRQGTSNEGRATRDKQTSNEGQATSDKPRTPLSRKRSAKAHWAYRPYPSYSPDKIMPAMLISLYARPSSTKKIKDHGQERQWADADDEAVFLVQGAASRRDAAVPLRRLLRDLPARPMPAAYSASR